MTEEARTARNRDLLQQANRLFRAALARVLARLQADGFRPRIQQCWRSPTEQVAAFRSGHSKLQWGFHNATAPDGTPDALAADVLDDDAPLTPRHKYLFALARAAQAEGLSTGIDWGLPFALKAALRAAVAKDESWLSDAGKPGPIGWDPCHVEITGISVAAARAGRRPSADGPVNV